MMYNGCLRKEGEKPHEFFQKSAAQVCTVYVYPERSGPAGDGAAGLQLRDTDRHVYHRVLLAGLCQLRDIRFIPFPVFLQE